MNKFVFFLVFAVLLGGGAWSQSQIEILVPEYLPYSSATVKNTLWCDLVTASFEKEGIKVKFTSYPLERMKALVKAGQNIALINSSLVVSPEESSLMIINEAPLIYADVVAFIILKSSPLDLG